MTGDTLNVFGPLGAELPGSNYPQLDVRNNHPCLDFDAAVDETCYFTGVLSRGYDGGGVTVTLHWAATSATSGAARWEIALERLTAQDIDSDGPASFKSAGTTTSGTSGIPNTTAIAFTSGSEMDSLAAGELFRLHVRRDADGTTGTDDMTGDAELLHVEIKET